MPQRRNDTVSAPSDILLDATGATVDPEEIARFSRIADEWWDPAGNFAPLHKLNPTRLAYLRDRLLDRFGRDEAALQPFAGLTLLDIGCGGGLVAEPMARLGFAVTGIDAAGKSLDVARAHAAAGGLAIDYRAATAEALAMAGERFDAVLALEIVEHVEELETFFAALGRLVRPGGAVILSTINRTFKSLALAKIGAEYVLRWVPAGTHDWRKFLRPSETAAYCRGAGLIVDDLRGISYEPLTGGWRLSRDLDVNYMLAAYPAE
jgi:2-polyprenyl-6-hydroxyphenyl methylase/3-demethylubiquinone-9 3-methyltransferase